MPQHRPHYRTKAEWAAAKASELRQQARQLRFQSSAGSYIKAARKARSVNHLDAQAHRYERLAARFRDSGA
jgi:hypothetical protein